MHQEFLDELHREMGEHAASRPWIKAIMCEEELFVTSNGIRASKVKSRLETDHDTVNAYCVSTHEAIESNPAVAARKAADLLTQAADFARKHRKVA